MANNVIKDIASGLNSASNAQEDRLREFFHPTKEEKYGTTSGGLVYLNDNDDSRINAANQQAEWDREDYLRDEAEKREDYELDRIFAAAKRNGINPALLLDSLSGNTGSAASYSTSAAKTSNYAASERTNQANSAAIVGAIIAAFAFIVSHA